MMLIAIISHDVRTVNGRGGGVASFTTHLLNLIRQHYPEDRIKLIYTTTYNTPQLVDEKWKSLYQDLQVELIETYVPRPAVERSPYNVAEQILGEQVYPHIADADIVYCADWGHAGFHLLRHRRFHTGVQPICVTVMHGATEWLRQGMPDHVTQIDELNRTFIERYAFAHSDYVVSPGRYMLGWLQAQGYTLPPQSHQRVLALPILKQPDPTEPIPIYGPCYKRLVFFNGRIERRKGIDLLVLALEMVHQQQALGSIEEVILLAAVDAPQLDRQQQAQERIRRLGLRVKQIGNYDSDRAQQFLRDNVSDTLVVIPSLVDNFPYAVIEASLIPGLNCICSAVGGIPEILGEKNHSYLFTPTPSSLAACLVEHLQQGPQGGLHPYNADRANQGWIDFHGELRDRVVERRNATQPVAISQSTVDVCIPYYNTGRFLPQLLQVLALQTYRAFKVIVVDDGSTDPESVSVFQNMSQQYPQWQFVHQENQFVDAARNAAARLGSAEYLMFIDPDDIISLNAIESMVHSIQISGDDVLSCNSHVFAGYSLPYDLDSGQMLCATQQQLTPLGANLVGGVTQPTVFGSYFTIIRRAVFEAIGGYTQYPGVGHEDWELFVRLSLAGYKLDVLPEFHHYYRKHGNGLSDRLAKVDCQRRLLRPYEEALMSVGLQGLTPYLLGLHQENEALKLQLRRRDRQHTLQQHPISVFPNLRQPSPIQTIFNSVELSFLERGLDPSQVGITDVLRLAYRSLVPLDRRLQWHELILKLRSRLPKINRR
jgi:O-antigen biosynthesis protein